GERVDGVGRAERLAVGPLDAVADREGQRLVAVAPGEALREPRRRLAALQAVDVGELLVLRAEREEVHARVEGVEPAGPGRALLVRDRDGGRSPARARLLAAAAGHRGQAHQRHHEREHRCSSHHPLLPGRRSVLGLSLALSLLFRSSWSSARSRSCASVPAPSSARPSRAAPTIGGELVTWTVAAGAACARPALIAPIRRASLDCISPPPSATGTASLVR